MVIEFQPWAAHLGSIAWLFSMCDIVLCLSLAWVPCGVTESQNSGGTIHIAFSVKDPSWRGALKGFILSTERTGSPLTAEPVCAAAEGHARDS